MTRNWGLGIGDWGLGIRVHTILATITLLLRLYVFEYHAAYQLASYIFSSVLFLSLAWINTIVISTDGIRAKYQKKIQVTMLNKSGEIL